MEPQIKKTKGYRVGDGTPGPGRPKGVPNKTTRVAKDAIAQVAENLGGVDRMTEWVREDRENEKAFWTSIYPKLLPLQVAGDENAPLIHKIVSEVVYPQR